MKPATTVVNSRGADVNPYSMYSTSNSYAHDLKGTIQPGPETSPRRKVGGFARNNPMTKLKEAPDVPNPKQMKHTNALIDTPSAPVHAQSLSAAAFAQTEKPSDDDAAICAMLASQRSKRKAGSGFSSNNVDNPTQHTEAEVMRPPHALAVARAGNKDPMAKENGWKGPAPYTTTNSAMGNTGVIDPDILDPEAVMDLTQRRVATNGAVLNRASTLASGTGMAGCMTEYRAQMQKKSGFDDDDDFAEASKTKKKPDHRGDTLTVGNHEEPPLPAPRTYLQQQTLKRTNPIEYAAMNSSATLTTAQAEFTHAADPNATTLQHVLDGNPTARRVASEDPNKRRMLKTLSGAPHKGAASGYASNQLVSVGPDTRFGGDQWCTEYRAGFQDQMKLEAAKGGMVTIKGATSGFEVGNMNNIGVDNGGTSEWVRKV